MNWLQRIQVQSLRPVHYVFAIVLIVRLLVLSRLSASAFLLPSRGDMHFYNGWALRILQGHWTDHLAFYGLPLYAYLLAAIYSVFGYSPFVPGILQACLDAGTAAILYKLGEKVFTRGERGENSAARAPQPRTRVAEGAVIGAAAALGWAFFQPAQAYSAILMPTVGLVFVFWFVVWAIVKRTELPRRFVTFLLGLLVGITATGVATILFLVPLLIAAFLISWNGTMRARTLAIFLLFVGLAAGTAPAWLHNCLIARDPVFLSAHGGVNFWIGNNPDATGYPRFPPGLHAGQEAMLKDSIANAERATGRSLRRSEVSSYWAAKSQNYIRSHFTDWLKLLGTKVGNFWNAFQYDDLSIITALREQQVVFPGLRFGIVAAIAIPGLFSALGRFPASRWIAAAILLHLFSLLPVFVTERYRLAAVPGLLLFAAFGICELWRSCAMAQTARVMAYLALLLGATWIVSIPKREPSLWALDSYNSGLQALETNHLSEAQQKLDLAYAYVPENAELNFALGNLQIAQGNKQAAKSFYAETLRLDPEHEGSNNNLGVLALEENRWKLAASFFSRALQQSPNDPKTYFLLAKSHLNSGEVESASHEIDQALKLDPDRLEYLALQKEVQRQSPPR